jgi:hypothetical protein
MVSTVPIRHFLPPGGFRLPSTIKVLISLLEVTPMKVLGILFVLMALTIGLVPQFTNCAVQGRAIQLPDGRSMPMKCHWTANATPVVAVPLLAAGIMLIFSRGKEARRGLLLLGTILGVSAILLPTLLIGVCANNEMVCKLAMAPTLIFSGIVSAIAGLFGLFLAGKSSTDNVR